jgi:iron complex transport system substrate-binding protein
VERCGESAQAARLYIGEPSAEAVAAQMPDLILISATGGDSALTLYDQLSTIAPTLIINYDDKSWQALLTQLGQITGHEKQAAARIAEFDKQLAALKEKMKLPPQPVTALVYTAAAHSANIWTPESAQGQMLEQLGFTLATCPAGCMPARARANAMISCSWAGKTGRRTERPEPVPVCRRPKDADAIYANPLLAHLPAVEGKRVYPLGRKPSAWITTAPCWCCSA